MCAWTCTCIFRTNGERIGKSETGSDGVMELQKGIDPMRTTLMVFFFSSIPFFFFFFFGVSPLQAYTCRAFFFLLERRKWVSRKIPRGITWKWNGCWKRLRVKGDVWIGT